MFEAFPTEKSIDFKECGGAYVSCWVKERYKDVATKKASDFIESQSWKIVNIEKVHIVDRELYERDANIQYYDEADQDGEAYVFHRWPNSPQEDENAH